VVIAAGVRRTGTEAAGERLTDTQCLEDAAKLARGDREHANIQLNCTGRSRERRAWTTALPCRISLVTLGLITRDCVLS
jgi:hypothetical protein